MRSRTRTRFCLGAAFVLAVAALTAIVGRPTVAYAQLDGDMLAGSQIRMLDRIQLLREEAKERRRELREAAERAREAKKHHKKGQHVEQIPADIDQLPANLRAGFALPPGFSQINAAPLNVMANNKTGDGAGAGQAEQSIVFLGNYGLCSWNDGQGFNTGTPYNVQGWGITVNGGTTWTDMGTPPLSGTITNWSSDPVVSVNEKTGEFYYCGLTGNTGSQNGLAVVRGHFSGSSWVTDGTAQVAVGSNTSYAFDKEWMAVDSLTGNVYVTYTRFTTTGDDIWFSRSTDGGATFQTPVQISGSWEMGYCSGSRPAVGPNGEVYVTYTSYGAVDADSIKLTRSTNFGTSFPPTIVAGTTMDNYFTGAPGFNRGRAINFPAIYVDRSTGCNRGRVYIANQNSVNFYLDTFSALTNPNYRPEVENNGNFANATLFTPGQNLRGTISSTTDNDNFKFNAVQGTTYMFFVDSVRTSTFKYTLRLFCPNDTTVLSRLAMSSDGSSSSSVNVHALIVWTAPTTNTYYLRMTPSTSTGGYRIRTTTHVARPSDLGRDTRDVTIFTSATGYTGWTGPYRVNDDAALYDNWLPEVAVGTDGVPYAMWFDWRDTPATCFGGSNIYVSRSLDAGTTWAANQVATTAPTPNWTQVVSNIAPNEGDYNGMSGGDYIGLAWADGRLGDSDVFAARINTTYSLSDCPGAQVVNAGSTFNTGVTVNNNNVMFGNTYNYTVTVDQPWAGYPATGTVGAGALGSGVVPVAISVPESAPDGQVVHVCVTTDICGAMVKSCCFDVTVANVSTPTLASLARSVAEPGRVSLSWLVDSRSVVNVYRSTDGTSWSPVASVLPDGEGYVNFDDANVTAGASYSYKLGLTVGGAEQFAGQTPFLSVPVSAEFALHNAFPSPASRGFSVSFSLPTNAPAQLDVIDLAGRRVVSRQVSGVGRHTLSLESETSRLPIGIYAVRLSQGRSVASTKVSVIR